MSQKQIQGKITFIHHEKERAIIEYTDNGRKKTIHADISAKEQQRLKSLKLVKKIHRYLMGDQVLFEIKKTGANGSQQYASNLQYQYNTALEVLLNKAKKENKFLGYVKLTDGRYFVKEIDSYLFFPLQVSPYEIPPTEQESTEPISFKLDNIENPDKTSASLYNHQYIPEFLSAVQHFKKQTPVQAKVQKITPFGIHVSLLDEKIKGKLAIDETVAAKITDGSIAVNSFVDVTITHLSPTRIVLEQASEPSKTG